MSVPVVRLAAPEPLLSPSKRVTTGMAPTVSTLVASSCEATLGSMPVLSAI